MPGRKLQLLVSDEELAQRRRHWSPPSGVERGYYRLYGEHVTQADQGVDFDFPVGHSGAPVPRESH